MLQIESLKSAYGALEVLHGIDLTVGQGEIVCLMGANGAGKSTMLKTISGVLKPTGGKVSFLNQDITGQPPHRVARTGLIQIPEGRRIFPLLSVRENLLIGSFLVRDSEDKRCNMERVFSLFPVLKDRIGQIGGTLSGGEQQMLAIGRALMAEPKLLLMDEPSMGLAPLLVERIFEAILHIAREGTPILLVEQNANMSLAIAARGYVMERGRITMAGPSDQLRRDDRVVMAYLGGKSRR